MEFQWREAPDGSALEALPPTRAVSYDPDDKRAGVTWVNLQMRCKCGSFLGVEVELVKVERAAEVAAESGGKESMSG